jgi:hypothetical protein
MKRSGSFCALLSAATVSASLIATEAAVAQGSGQLDTLKDLFKQLGRCWRSPRLPAGDLGMQITVLVAFNGSGEILGQPRITYESETASDDDRLAYRKAVMETLQRCTPLPFTDGFAGAIAGRPITFRFDDRRKPPKPKERDVWLTQKIL